MFREARKTEQIGTNVLPNSCIRTVFLLVIYDMFIRIAYNLEKIVCFRLRDESLVSKLILRMEAYLEKTSDVEMVSKIYLLRIEHIYYKVRVDLSCTDGLFFPVCFLIREFAWETYSKGSSS